MRLKDLRRLKESKVTSPPLEKFQLTVTEHLETSDNENLIYTFCLLTFLRALQCKLLH